MGKNRALQHTSIAAVLHIMNKIINKYTLPLVVLFGTFATHFINFWQYPEFYVDEGIYVTQGWWSVNNGQLSPYTYFYDHPPLGWIFIGLWFLLTGGPFTFGIAVVSARLLMVIIASFANMFTYLLLERVTSKKIIALAGTIFLIFSPLSIYFHRQVLLDNIQNLWLAISLYLLVSGAGKLKKIIGSALVFGIATLSKEFALFVYPAYLYLVWSLNKGALRLYALSTWLITTLFVIGLFPLTALLRNEFLSDQITGGKHVSLLETVSYQLSRGGGEYPWIKNSYFNLSSKEWLSLDGAFLTMGIISVLVLLIYSLYKRKPIIISTLIAALCYGAFLLRGQLTQGFYIIPVLTFLAISISLVIDLIYRNISNRTRQLLLRSLIVILSIITLYLLAIGGKLYTQNRVEEQVAVLAYIRQNLSQKDVIISDDWMFLDLKLPYSANSISFPLSEMAKKVDRDPATIERLNNTWKSIDYIVDRQNLIDAYSVENNTILYNAYINSDLVIDFTNYAGESTTLEAEEIIQGIKSGTKDQQIRYTLRKVNKEQ